jgi:putative ABC transport system permease protein
MNLLVSVRIALVALRVNALRSLLAMLGVIIGVGSVIVMVSVSAGAKQKVEQVIANIGANMLTVRAGTGDRRPRQQGEDPATPLTDRDVEALKTEVPGLAAVAGYMRYNKPVVYGNANWTTGIIGASAAYLEVRDWSVAEGREITEADVRGGAKVALLGETVREHLFGDVSPLGATVRIANVPFEVVGVLGRKGESAWGTDQDDQVLVPLTTARKRLFGSRVTVRDSVQLILAEAANAAALGPAQAEIEVVMRARHRIAVGAADDFYVRNATEQVNARNETSSQLGLLLAATAGISLVVGGIGIMNIMLVAVTERTREIGLRMALGARRRDIRNQFLVEAVVLCLTGGLIGLACGVAVTVLIARGGEFPVVIEPAIVLAAVGSSALVGMFFGLYPAHRASRLNPIEALRHE